MDRSPEEIVLDPDLIQRLVVGIGEVAEITGVPKRQLRYWQEKGIVEPVSGGAGTTRRFDYLNVKKVLLVKELLDEGYTLDAAADKVDARMKRLSQAFEQLAGRSEKPKGSGHGETSGP